MFPPVVLVIPLFVVLAKLRLVDTHFGLVLALVTFNLPFVTWLLRGYFLGLPREIEDAARIDGCGRFGVLFRIALPLSAPGVAAAATLAMVNSWNDFLFAFVLINDDTKRVLATGVAAYAQSNNDYTTLFAMATLTTVPIVLAVHAVPAVPRRRAGRRLREELTPRNAKREDEDHEEMVRCHGASSCGQASRGPPAARWIGTLGDAVRARAAAAADPVKGPISFWSRETFNNGARQPLLKELAAAFDKRNPGATTTVQFMPFQESIAKTQAALAAGNPPDLGQQGPDVGTQFAAAGNLLDLTAVAARAQGRPWCRSSATPT